MCVNIDAEYEKLILVQYHICTPLHTMTFVYRTADIYLSALSKLRGSAEISAVW